MRLHKELLRSNIFPIDEIDLFNTLNDLKNNTDNKIISNSNILENESFIETMLSRMVYDTFKENHNVDINIPNTEYISRFIKNEYINEFNGGLN